MKTKTELPQLIETNVAMHARLDGYVEEALTL